jgi:hypothetical protein
MAPGRIDEVTLDALYRGAAVLAMPSRSEGFGLPALEAMARGCPVVASDAGALPEVVGDAGLLIPPGDPTALAAALHRVLSDESFAASLGAAGHQRAATFTWSACTAAHLAAYHAALGLPAPPPPLPPPGPATAPLPPPGPATTQLPATGPPPVSPPRVGGQGMPGGATGGPAAPS